MSAAPQKHCGAASFRRGSLPSFPAAGGRIPGPPRTVRPRRHALYRHEARDRREADERDNRKGCHGAEGNHPDLVLRLLVHSGTSYRGLKANGGRAGWFCRRAAPDMLVNAGGNAPWLELDLPSTDLYGGSKPSLAFLLRQIILHPRPLDWRPSFLCVAPIPAFA
jgi:hypothetical protein